MRFVAANDVAYEPAGHESPTDPGVWKKVLLVKDDLQVGRVQMINWAKLPAGNRFAPHYHEDMQEVFVMMTGRVRLRVDERELDMGPEDTVLIDAREVHEMYNPGDEDAEYLAIGIARTANGRTVVVAQ